MASTKTRTWAFRVIKSQRGMRGEWFRYPTAATFSTQTEAEEYAARFAESQRGVAGTRILVVARKGDMVVREFRVQ